MARKPYVIDSESEFGRLHVLDLGGGHLMLMIEGDADALTFPLDATEATALARYLAGGSVPRGGAGTGRPRLVSDDDLREVATLYQSEEAGKHQGGRVPYVADTLGIGHSAANYRVGKAREAGFITESYR